MSSETLYYDGLCLAIADSVYNHWAKQRYRRLYPDEVK
jgi:hypothetical protein